MGLSVQEKLEKGYEIWVRNMTAGPPAMIAMTFRHQGAEQRVAVPPGRYPYRLYPGELSKDMVAHGGQQLHKFLVTGALKLVTKKRARSMLKESGAKDEQQALWRRANDNGASQAWARQQKRQAEGLGSAQPKSDEYVYGPPGLPEGVNLSQTPLDQLKERLGDLGDGPSKAKFQLSQSGPDAGVQGKVLGIMTRWSTESDEGVLQQLKAIRSTLTSADLRYIQQTCRRNTRTYKWANLVSDKIERSER